MLPWIPTLHKVICEVSVVTEKSSDATFTFKSKQPRITITNKFPYEYV